MKDFGTNTTENVTAQYTTASNLNARIELHKRFSTNEYGWSNWVFDQLLFDGKKRILELGCGNGDLWRTNTQRKLANIHVVLSDFSNGMMETAKQRLEGLSHGFEFQVIDAQNIPYENQTFDMVIANHMLYHVPDRKKALAEICRVLRNDGTLYATTIGLEHLKELMELVHGFADAICYPVNSVANDFGLESGIEQLREFFRNIKVLRYVDSLEATEANLLVDYVLSSQGFGNVTEIITGDKKKEFKGYVSSLIEKNGSIKIKKDSGMLIASR